ncbi:MAG: O-antigen/teichoic acid export membrane protein, partial [Bradymonadia bacterium]
MSEEQGQKPEKQGQKPEEQGLSRQALFIPLAKVWFILCSFALQVLLPNLLEADQYGDYGIVNRGISVINMIMVTGSIQSVSKFVSEDPSAARSIRRAALRVQVFFGGGLALAYFLAAPMIANGFNDPSLTGFIRISALIPACYAFYAVYIGTLNGLRRFKPQGLFDMAYATMKSGGILAAAALGYGVNGVFTAFAGAAGVILLLAVIHGRTVTGKSDTPFPAKRLMFFAAPVVAFVGVNQFLLSADLFVAKSLMDPEISAQLSGAYFG